MRKRNIYLKLCGVQLAVALWFVLTACIPEPLEVDGIPVVKPQIVVNTQIIPDQSLVVLLTKSFGALDASEDSDAQELLDQIAVEDATVTITNARQTYNLIALGSGIYGGILIPFGAGEEYTLHVKSESLGEVSATTMVKPMISFDEVEAELYFDGYDDTLVQVIYTLTDPMEKNWYMLNVQQIERDELIEDALNPRAFMRLLDDAEFESPKYGEAFRAFQRDFDAGDTVAVFLSNISEEYYNFMRLRLDNRFSFIEYLSEPVNYPSNVVGGKGFFNLYVPDVRTFVLEEK
jgi:anthranilate/para-aminobenzoate synthase component I